MRAGRELEVDWVVDGTLQHDGAQLRASARLLSVADGTAAWSDRFDAAWTSVFDVQDQIAERVAQALGRHLAHAPSATRNVDAYQLYLGGLNHAQGLVGNGLHKSIELYEHALQIDPGYALAHVGIAEACRRMVFGADRDPVEVYAQWRPHQTRALELAPALPDAHAQLGWLRYWCDHDWAGAERAFRHALVAQSQPRARELRIGLHACRDRSRGRGHGPGAQGARARPDVLAHLHHRGDLPAAPGRHGSGQAQAVAGARVRAAVLDRAHGHGGVARAARRAGRGPGVDRAFGAAQSAQHAAARP